MKSILRNNCLSRRLRRILVCTSTCALVCAAWTAGTSIVRAENAAQPMSAVDHVEMPRLSSPRLSPGGRYLIYRRSLTDWTENKIVRRYRLLDLETGASLPVPEPGEADESFGAVVWRPDGSGFATLLEREDDKHDQIYFYSLEDASFKKLTDHGASISSIRWSPNGQLLYFVAPRQRSDEEKRLLDGDWVIEPYDTPRLREIWTLDTQTLTTDPLVTGDFSVRSMSLSRDGRQLVYRRAPSHEPDATHDGEIWTLDLASGEQRRWTDNHHRESSPRLSPDNGTMAYIATVNQALEPYYEDKVFTQDRERSAPRRLLADAAMEALDHAWDKSGEGLYILGNTGVRTDLYHLTLANGELRRLTEGDHVVADWSYDPEIDVHVARIATPRNPGDIYLMRSIDEGFVRVSDEYADWQRRFRLPRQQAVRWTGPGNVEIEGLLAYPLGYEEGRRYPLVTITHGGPRSSSQFGSWNTSRYVAVLAGQGYAVLLPNHRGGTGYGDAFMRDMYGAYFRNAHYDVLAGVDAMIESGIADPDRLVKMGWSAGGHMVNKLITMTDRFGAASSGAGAAEWLTMHAESDVRHTRQWNFGGFPWQENAPIEQYRSDSPLFSAARVRTPTLFFSGANDVRVPPTQSIIMHRAVRAAGAPTKFYLAKGQPHNYSKPSFQLFKMNAELGWYAEHALGSSYEPVYPELPAAEDEAAEDADGSAAANADADDAGR